MDTGLMFSSETDEWNTPDDFYARLSKLFKFTLDPCATDNNRKCEQHFTKAQDGLAQSWLTEGAVFMNPPYGRGISKWVRKAYEEAQKGTPVVCLLPARVDTAWWHDYCSKGLVVFVRGRLKFSDHKHNAPFPNAVVIFHPMFMAAGRSANG